MFTASDFKIMERKCPNERDKLLKLLEIKVSLPFAEDDFKSYESLDVTIEKKLVAKLNSTSVVDGYAKLLDTGGVAFSLSETNNEILAKILANREKILSAAPAQIKDNNSSSDSGLSGYKILGGFLEAVGAGAILYSMMASTEPNYLIVGAGGAAVIAGIFFLNKKPEPQAQQQSSDKLSREQIKAVLPILEQVNKIFNSI